jgi:hypothetical protein
MIFTTAGIIPQSIRRGPHRKAFSTLLTAPRPDKTRLSKDQLASEIRSRFQAEFHPIAIAEQRKSNGRRHTNRGWTALQQREQAVFEERDTRMNIRSRLRELVRIAEICGREHTTAADDALMAWQSLAGTELMREIWQRLRSGGVICWSSPPVII